MVSRIYFAQVTDPHVGSKFSFCSEEATRNLHWALKDLASLNPCPALVLVTGDLVCVGTSDELREYRELIKGSPIPLYHLAGNHDIANSDAENTWKKIIGPLMQSTTVGELQFLLWKDMHYEKGVWRSQATPEQMEWIKEQLSTWAPNPTIIAFHNPIQQVGGTYINEWKGSNTDKLLSLFTENNVIAMVTGHLHWNGEWMVNGIPLITTGPLCGWQWNDTPPHYTFPIRPGYRLFCFENGVIRSFWRDGPYYGANEAVATGEQVTLVKIGSAHTGGPRPQVRLIDVFGKVRLLAKAYSPKGRIVKVEWRLVKGEWHPMKRTFQGIWSEWEAELDPAEFHTPADYICVVRAESAEGSKAYDAVPIRLNDSASSGSAYTPSQEERRMLFEPFDLPE